MQCTVFLILPLWSVFFFAFSLPPFTDPTYINILTNGKQDVLKQREANTNLLYFFGSELLKALLKQISLYLLLHSRIRIIILTRPDNIKCYVTSLQEIISRNQITQIKMLQGQYSFR